MKLNKLSGDSFSKYCGRLKDANTSDASSKTGQMIDAKKIKKSFNKTL